MSEAKLTPVREAPRTPSAILAAQAVNVLERLQHHEAPRRIEILQIAIALTAAEIQQSLRAAQPRDE